MFSIRVPFRDPGKNLQILIRCYPLSHVSEYPVVERWIKAGYDVYVERKRRDAKRAERKAAAGKAD